MSCISAFGEEIGWRGYLVPRLVEAEVPAPFLTSPLIWCAWHVPLILWAGYAVGPYPALSALVFVASITPVGLLTARWRMASGSVWPCVIAHGSWNVVIQSVFDPFSEGPRSALVDRRIGPPHRGGVVARLRGGPPGELGGDGADAERAGSGRGLITRRRPACVGTRRGSVLTTIFVKAMIPHARHPSHR